MRFQEDLRAQEHRSFQEYKNQYAFAAINQDGSVSAWGDEDLGGSIEDMQSVLQSGVREIFSSAGAFAALKNDGSVVTWGSGDYGGDSSNVKEDLTSGVIQVYSTASAFSALKEDGSVISWGGGVLGYDDMTGADNSGAKDKLNCGVVSMTTSGNAFAALKSDGSVVTWGDGCNGEDYCTHFKVGHIKDELSSNVDKLFSNGGAFAALKMDGSVVTWGLDSLGGRADWAYLGDGLSSGVKDIFVRSNAFAALKEDGSVVTWGDLGPYPPYSELDSGVERIFSTDHSFLALKSDGSAVFWGFDGESPDLDEDLNTYLNGVANVFTNGSSFAALKNDGSVITWGNTVFKEDGYVGWVWTDSVEDKLRSGVVDIASTETAFAALRDDGSVVTWGAGDAADSSEVREHLLSNVIEVHSNRSHFSAIKNTGEVILWPKIIYQQEAGVVNLEGKQLKTVSNPFTTNYSASDIDEKRVSLAANNCNEESFEITPDPTTPILTPEISSSIKVPVNKKWSKYLWKKSGKDGIIDYYVDKKGNVDKKENTKITKKTLSFIDNLLDKTESIIALEFNSVTKFKQADVIFQSKSSPKHASTNKTKYGMEISFHKTQKKPTQTEMQDITYFLGSAIGLKALKGKAYGTADSAMAINFDDEYLGWTSNDIIALQSLW